MVTVLLGTALLAELGPGLRAERPMLALVSAHVTLATIAIVLTLVGLVAEVSGLVWLAFAVLLAVAGLGTTMLVRTSRSRISEADGAADDVPPPEVSNTIVLIHGVAAGAALLVVLLAAITR